MSHLAPCPACNRHIAVDEVACPFCAAALPEAFHTLRPPPAARGRMSRAAMLAAGATLVGVAACDNLSMPEYGAPPLDGSMSTDASGGSGGAASGGSGGGGAGGTAPSDAGSDAIIAPPYGIPPGNSP